jgi:ABC-type sulfate/molybdate transport systems ATPase subunit
VRGNARFGATRERRADGFIDALLARLRLTPLAGRRPGGLSGGERQRVALARALAADARVLLFDEPFAAIDPTARPELQAELRALLAELHVPALFVTHDHLEARALADDVAILHDGALVQRGPIEEVFAAPADPFVARFVGIENRWGGRITAREADAVIVALDDAPVSLVAHADPSFTPGMRVLACVRAEDVEVESGPIDARANSIAVRGATARSRGAFVLLELGAPIPLRATVSKRDAARVLETQAALVARIAPSAVHLVRLSEAVS